MYVNSSVDTISVSQKNIQNCCTLNLDRYHVRDLCRLHVAIRQLTMAFSFYVAFLDLVQNALFTSSRQHLVMLLEQTTCKAALFVVVKVAEQTFETKRRQNCGCGRLSLKQKAKQWSE